MKNGRGREREREREREGEETDDGRGCTLRDRRKLEMFQSRAAWTDPWTLGTASVAPMALVGKPKNPGKMVFNM